MPLATSKPTTATTHQHPTNAITPTTPIQAKLVREFITLPGCDIQINNDPKAQSVAVPGATTTYCRVGFG